MKPQKHLRMITEIRGGGFNSPTKCIYTNAHSMSYTQEELEAIKQEKKYEQIAIMETRWDDCQNWPVVTDGYKLFRWDRQGRKDVRVVLYVRECFDCLESNDGDDRVVCLWLRIVVGKANMADMVANFLMGFYPWQN